MKKILLLSMLCVQVSLYAQEDAWVYLNQKENVQNAIDNPISILSQKAIDRKSKHGIAIDERDVPVNESYITALKSPETGVTVFAKSKWLNAVYVSGTLDAINALVDDYDFVEAVEFADSSLNQLRGTVTDDKFLIENGNVIFNYGSTQNQVEMIQADALHMQDYTGEGIIVAVLDSGFSNVDTMGGFDRLRDNGGLLGAYDFVRRTANVYAFEGDDHGTKVLSNMSGFVEDQFVGTAPDASYYLFLTEDVGSETPVEEAYWVEAAERSDSLGVHIINSSLGYKTYQNPRYTHTAEDLNGSTTFVTRGANIANEKGMLVVTSAGNSGANGVGAPADATGVLSIAAVNVDGDYAAFSSQGSTVQATHKPDVAARGVAAFVIDDANTIVNNSGTSFSSPIMAGGIASLWQALPNATNEAIKKYVRMSASQYTTPDFFVGYGIPNLQLALEIGLSLQEGQRFEFKVYPNPARDILNIELPSTTGVTNLRIIDMLGASVLEQDINGTKQLDISKVAQGLYIIVLESANATKTFKLIKS